MSSRTFSWAVRLIVVLVLAAGASALAQAPKPDHFSGTISDYTPSNVGGPWEMRGTWSLKLKGDSGKADFSAALIMELSDYTRTPSNVDTTTGAGSRLQHTHHLTIEDGVVTPLPTGGFEVSGPVTITKDGGPAPLQGSMLYVDITGGTIVEYSNITLRFQGGATNHFGSQLIHGVVRQPKKSAHDD